MIQMMRRTIMLGLFAVVMACSTTLADEADFDGVAWISVDEELQHPNQWLCFRKQITLSGDIPEQVYMDIAVDSKYWLWVNGELAVFEGGLKRGPNPDDTYYDSVDIADYLVKGDNTLALLVWYWGKDGYCHKSSGKSGLLARITCGDDTICTDSSWKVCLHPAFGVTGEPHPNYRLPESNVHYDARKALGRWMACDYDDAAWAEAAVLGVYPCAPWNRLHARPFPNWRDSGIQRYEKVTTRKEEETVVVTGTLPRNITVTPYLKVRAAAGQTIDIRSDNYKGGSEYNVRAEYVTRNGVQEFEMPNYVNGHSILYTLPKGVKVLKVGYRETRFDTEILGSFRCSDDFYNTLWQKSLNTMNLNMRDAIQDPDRERSQWWGDAAIISNEIYYSCDEHGLAAVKKAILNLVDWQKPDGTLYSPVPAGSWHQELPLQMLASVGRYGFGNYYTYTADTATIRYVYPRVKRYLSLWNIGEHGLVKHRAGGWDWADWGSDIDVPVLDNAWYCLALEAAIDMARLLGDTAFIPYYTAQLQLVRQASTEAFWQGSYFRSDGYDGITDDRANGLALLAGFADEAKERKVVDLLGSRRGASPYMEKYVLEALFSKGYTREALARMKQQYADMVASELTTLWEDWTVGGAGGGSINHGWAGSALSLLPQYVAGVSPHAAGWDTIMVRPQLGQLEWVDCIVPIGDATIKVDVKQGRDGRYEIKVVNASSKPYIVAFPKAKIMGDALKINGTLHALPHIPALYASDDDYLYLLVEEGECWVTNKR